MSYENVKAYFDNAGLGDRVTVREQIGDTVEHAAEIIGCEPARIAKTMSFLLESGPILVVSAGDAKVNSSKFKSAFHQKAVMIPPGQVESLVGHEPGAVCPFAVNEGVKVYLDISLKRFDTVHAAGGSLNSTVHLTADELVRHSHMAGWVDLCKGWLVNDPAEESKDVPGC
jgi:prolyl-tRNA editing enzyme YbaK/EbsC (Cys-tRNA(Pro) deacylase)